ncbi:RNA polymerase sigma-70 factor [Flammeovirgaceae bacterium SG7u.111]|nr:RNA polymerase sigma-70 factor [Flammeovirgaceae bacterium SG7u.132]WPO33397.1 RNA polymerase sigma-70 factor [Flammeovirgaceae bacterium SG7u.111]
MGKNCTILDLDDPNLFSRIYRIYFKDVFSVCYGVTGDVEIAKELTQEVFQSLWERRKGLNIEKGLDRYLMKSAKYKSIDQLRKQKIRKEIRLESSFEKIDKRTSENDFGYYNLQSEINSAVADLPHQCRQVFMLSREKGFTNKEIAGSMMIAEKTVKNHINKALKLIRSHLKYE